MKIIYNQIETGSDFSKSIDLEETTSKLKHLSTSNRSSELNNSNNSSSGCSSGTSSSNLSTERRLSKNRPDSSLSNWSTNKFSTPSPPPQLLPALRSLPSIRPATSQKSILSATSRELMQKCSTPVDTDSRQFLYVNKTSGLLRENRSFCKKKKREKGLFKSDSTNSFGSVMVMKPGLMLQSSIASTGKFLFLI